MAENVLLILYYQSVIIFNSLHTVLFRTLYMARGIAGNPATSGSDQRPMHDQS